jgi:hypothetical protein
MTPYERAEEAVSIASRASGGIALEVPVLLQQIAVQIEQAVVEERKKHEEKPFCERYKCEMGYLLTEAVEKDRERCTKAIEKYIAENRCGCIVISARWSGSAKAWNKHYELRDLY